MSWCGFVCAVRCIYDPELNQVSQTESICAVKDRDKNQEKKQSKKCKQIYLIYMLSF